MVKEYEKIGSSSVIFILNLEKGNSVAEKNVFIEDKHIETAIAVLRYFTHNGVDVEVVYDNGEINTTQCSNSFDFLNIYEALLKGASALALTGYDVITDKKLLEEIKREFVKSTELL